ncbi:MAG: FAD-dependent oxidoreductase [Planctomycetaceae bacterium]|nr:FAD-dependent oxidoreductase [Planctomycetaceae bacterium]
MTASRRLFLKSAATGTLLAPVTLLTGNLARGEESALVVHPPDHKTGEVIRTTGELLPTGEFLREERRLVPVAGASEVLVCGGGPAGIAAALAAARSGAKTQLLEFAGCLGGVWTAGLLTKILDAGNKSGIMREILTALSERGSHVAKETDGTVYDPELAKRVLEEMCVGAGISIQLHTLVVGAVTDERNRLVAVITESKSGRQAWLAERFIDCTGDGDLAAQAGCQFDVGLSENCECQPMSLMALITGLDPIEVEPYLRETESAAKQRLYQLMQKAGINPSYKAPTLRYLHDGIFSLMTNHEYGVSAFDAGAISQATINARKEVFEIVEGLRKIGEPWARIAVVATAEQIGVREGRRIKGRYALTGADLVAGLRHPQAVARAKFPFDVHALELSGNPDVVEQYRKRGVKAYDIPYPALLSAEVDNLLMAGRCISGDFLAHSSYRVTGNAVPMGEAAGTAAAQSIAQRIMPYELEWKTARSNS